MTHLHGHLPAGEQRTGPVAPRQDEARDPGAFTPQRAARHATGQAPAAREVVTAEEAPAAAVLLNVVGARTVRTFDDRSTAAAEKLVATQHGADTEITASDVTVMPWLDCVVRTSNASTDYTYISMSYAVSFRLG